VDAARYDAVVYTIGDSWFHHDTLGLARRYPGIVWFHDLDLTGLYLPYAHRMMGSDPSAGATVIREALAGYGERAPDLPIGSTDLRWTTPDPYRHAGVRFTLELARAAATNIVPSQRALRVLELDAGPAELLPPAEVLPISARSPRRAGANADPQGTPVVVALGRLGFDTKRPDALLDAIAVVAKTRPVRLAIVGEIHPAVEDRLTRRITDLGLTRLVEITGYLPDSEYRRRVDGATVAVQLGGYELGQGSATVGDALAAGVPVITDIASCRELAPGTVDLLDPDAGPDSIAGAVLHVLDDAGHASELRRAGEAHASSWSFEDVAARLLDIIDAAKDRRWLEPQSA
jgi:glycosyltransferase involved in cell wall biosynthesis